MDEGRGLFFAGDRSYPAQFLSEPSPASMLEAGFRSEYRRALVCFENRWCLSTIWGDNAYGSNYNMSFRNEKLPFIEEPTTVEVGVLTPNPIHHEAMSIDLGDRVYERDAWDSDLWGDPLAYVDVPSYNRVAEIVMHLPRDIDIEPYDGQDAEAFCDYLITAGMGRMM